MPVAQKPLHLLIADAFPAGLRAEPPAPPPAMPPLDALLKQLHLANTIAIEEDSPETPYERALADAYGLPGAPGQVPWAAFQNGVVGTPCAWVRPCFWQLSLDSVALLHPAELALTADESRGLLEPVQELMAADGLQLDYVEPNGWLARGELFRGLTTWSVQRAAEQTLSREAIATTATEAQRRELQRHQTEWQMLLKDHPVNDAREADQRPFVNALWLDGAGILETPVARGADVIAETRLIDAGSDDAARTAAWQVIAADHAPALQAAVARGQAIRITFCGPQKALSYSSGRGMGAHLRQLLHPTHLADAFTQLAPPLPTLREPE